jgi:hypothetical protein
MFRTQHDTFVMSVNRLAWHVHRDNGRTPAAGKTVHEMHAGFAHVDTRSAAFPGALSNVTVTS